MPQDPVIYSSNLQSGLTLTDPTLTGNVKLQEGFVNITAATTLNATDHAGRLMRFNVAAGATVTLPAATGTGNRYRFAVNTTVTSNQDRIIAAGSDLFYGSLLIEADADSVADATISFRANGSTHNSIDMNGTTQGGIAGDYIELVDIASAKWNVWGILQATGTEITPFEAN